METENTSASVCLSPRSLFKKWLTLKRDNIDQAVYSHTHSNPQTCFSRKAEFRICAETCMIQPCLKSHISPTKPPSSVSPRSRLTFLPVLPPCAGAVKTTVPWADFAASWCHPHTTPVRISPSFQPELQCGAGRLAWKVWLQGGCASKTCPASERASKAREEQNTGTAVLGTEQWGLPTKLAQAWATFQFVFRPKWCESYKKKYCVTQRHQRLQKELKTQTARPILTIQNWHWYPCPREDIGKRP